MKISLDFVKDYVDIADGDVSKIIDKLTVTTCELEGVEYKGKDFDGLVVGLITESVSHPNSDHLHLLKVDIGAETLDIVCGAGNVGVGKKVVIVTVGGHIAGSKIKTAKLGGYISYGMCCSAQELGLAAESEGIIELDSEVSVGSDAKAVLGLDDIILEIDNKSLTNRPDLWGHYGFAREIAAILGKPLQKIDTAALGDYAHLPKVDATVKSADCMRYGAIRVSDVSGQTPLYIQRRLMYCDIRPINMVADLTNYVMLELGQPMHAFDADVVSGVCVKDVESDIQFVTLDKVCRKVSAGTMMITDAAGKPVAVAGVMGGLDGGITEGTKNVLIESACFRPLAVRTSARRLALRTDASNRYEKTLDPENVAKATSRYIKLLTDICPHCSVVSAFTDIYTHHYPVKVIKVSHALIEKYLGQSIDIDNVKRILTSLDMTVLDDEYSVQVPSIRATKDISIAEDIVEEVTRVYGYDRIVPKPYISEIMPAMRNLYHEMKYSLKSALSNVHEYNEVHSYVFKNKNFIAQYELEDESNTRILGALSPDHSELRNNIEYSVLEYAFENAKHSGAVSIYEIGRQFDGLGENGLVREQEVLCMAVSGKTDGAQLYRTLATHLSTVLQRQKNIEIKYVNTRLDNAHEKMSAVVMMSGEMIGKIYVVHPKISMKFDKKLNVAIASVDMKKLHSIEGGKLIYHAISKYPSIDLDISYLAPKDMNYENIASTILQKKNRILNNISLVEVYKDASLGEYKSVTIRYSLGSMNKTLTTEDVKSFGERMSSELESIGLTLRFAKN